MTRGRPPKPIGLLKAQGTYNATRHADREHTANSEANIEQPAWLSDDARGFWQRNVPKLEAMGILDGIDEATVTALAVAWGNWRKEQADYDAGNGHIYKVSCAWNAFDKIGSKFGLNPVDRTKLTIEKPSDELDPFEQWLKAKNEADAEWKAG